MTITWTNGSGGRVNGMNWVRTLDFVEIANRINRLRALEFLGPDNTLAAPFVADTGIVWTPGIYELRNAYPGIIGGRDASPACNYMRWLADSGSPISPSTSPPGGESSFFSLLNGGTNWTGNGPWIAAVDLNELRKGMELLTHGLWKFPVYFDGGLFSPLPTTPWFGGSVAYSTTYGELRTVGFVEFSFPPMGLTNVTVRGSSKIWVTGDTACTVEVGRITTPLTVNGGVSRTWGRTWNSPWSTPGGDYVSIGTASLSPGIPVAIPAASAIQAMIDSGPAFQNILIRKTAPDNMATVNVTASVDVEFDVVN